MFDSEPEPSERDGNGRRPTTVLLERLVAGAPGPEAVATLAGLDATMLDEYERVLALQAWDRQQSWVAARTLQMVATVAGPEAPADDRDDEFAACEVAAALRLAPSTGRARVELARSLTTRLAPTMDALEAGTLTFTHVQTVEHELWGKDDTLVAAVQARVLAAAGTITKSELARRLRRGLSRLAPVAVEQAHAEAAQARCVRLWAEPDGMASILATLVASDAAELYDRLTRLALCAERQERADAREHGVEPDEVGIDARRADALVALGRAGAGAAGAGADADTTSARPRRRTLGVVVSLSSLLGHDEQPGELGGYGALPASVCRRLAGDADWQLLLTEAASGRLVGMSRSTYAPPEELVEFLCARDRTCVFPHCSMPAWRCDADHRLAYGAGGATSADNLQPLCRTHHRAKTLGGWRCTRDPVTGATTWTSPAGMRYVVPPARYPPE